MMELFIYWYKDKSVTNDNVYSGIYTIKNESSAIAEVSNFKTINYTQLFANSNIKMNNIYYMNLSVSSRIINGEEKLDGKTDELDRFFKFFLTFGTFCNKIDKQ